MLSQFRYIVILSFILSGCGFQPLYGTNGDDIKIVSAAIRVNPVNAGRVGQELRTHLENFLNPMARQVEPEYALDVILEEKEIPLVIEQDREVTRYNLTFTAKYTLTDLKSAQAVESGQARIVGSYDAVESDFGTYAAKHDTRSRIMREMAKDIKVRLMAFLLRSDRNGNNS